MLARSLSARSLHGTRFIPGIELEVLSNKRDCVIIKLSEAPTQYQPGTTAHTPGHIIADWLTASTVGAYSRLVCPPLVVARPRAAGASQGTATWRSIPDTRCRPAICKAAGPARVSHRPYCLPTLPTYLKCASPRGLASVTACAGSLHGAWANFPRRIFMPAPCLRSLRSCPHKLVIALPQLA